MDPSLLLRLLPPCACRQVEWLFTYGPPSKPGYITETQKHRIWQYVKLRMPCCCYTLRPPTGLHKKACWRDKRCRVSDRFGRTSSRIPSAPECERPYVNESTAVGVVSVGYSPQHTTSLKQYGNLTTILLFITVLSCHIHWS